MRRENANHSCTFVHLSLLASSATPPYVPIVKKKTTAKSITLKTVIDHIQAFQQKTEIRFDRMENRMGSLEKRMEDGFARVDRRLSWMDLRISNIDERLDRIEITMIEQNHEGRIRKCEKAIATINRR